MAADEAGRQEGQARIYGPRRCGPDGATECSYVVLGRLEEDWAGGGPAGSASGCSSPPSALRAGRSSTSRR